MRSLTLSPAPLEDLTAVRQFCPDSKSEAELQAAAELTGAAFTYERVFHDARPMTFLPNGTIGMGAAGRELLWNIRRADGIVVLDISSETEVTCSLVQNVAGEWTGRWFHAEQMPIVLTRTGPNNAVISGLFFDSFASPPTGGYGVIAMGVRLTRSIGVDANGNPVYRQYHTDAQGSVLAITDGNANLVTNYQIDAWGNVLSGSSPGNAFDFLGGLGLCYSRSLISRGEVRVGTGFGAEWIHSGRSGPGHALRPR